MKQSYSKHFENENTQSLKPIEPRRFNIVCSEPKIRMPKIEEKEKFIWVMSF